MRVLLDLIQLADLEPHDHGRPFAAGGSTTKCCSTGTQGFSPMPAGPIECIETRGPARVGAVLETLDEELGVVFAEGR